MKLQAMDVSESGPVVFVVDDDSDVRSSLTRLLRSAGRRVEAFASGREFLERAARDAHGCLVADVRLPDGDGLSLLGMLRGAGFSLPVVFITGWDDVATGVRAMKVGAEDYLLKPLSETTFLNAVERAIQRDAERRKDWSERANLLRRYATLTERERQVFALLVKGLRNKQIAGQLGTTERTIKVHRSRIMQKMGAGSLAELVRGADRLGLGEAPVPPPVR